MKSKQIIACGGGGFTNSGQISLIDLYILSQSNVRNPKVCFLPTASGDDGSYIKNFKNVFDRLKCRTSVLHLMNPRIDDIESFLLSQDIIYVGGGNSKTMLGIWKEWGVDTALRKAYDNGVILSGISAGSVCWFDQCLTDSFPGRMAALNCLGLLDVSNCPHYSSQLGRIDAYRKMIAEKQIKPGYAVDDNAGIHFKDGEFFRAFTSHYTCKVFKVNTDPVNGFVENDLNAIDIGDEKNIEEIIWNSETFKNFRK